MLFNNPLPRQVSKFCEYHSRHAAYHLAHSVHVFMRDSALPAPITQAHLMDKFLEGKYWGALAPIHDNSSRLVSLTLLK